jgi:uncharacterized membrane protein
MDTQQILALLSRWLHVIPAMVLVGGALFLRFALLPAANEVGGQDEFREAVRRRWAKWVMISVLLMLISGFYNAYLKAIGYQLSPVYLALLTIKILLAFFVFYLASVLTGRSKTAKKFRQKEIFWLNVLCASMIAIVAVAGWMKLSSQPIKVRSKEPADQVSVQTDQRLGKQNRFLS